jgi:hypothetical protein
MRSTLHYIFFASIFCMLLVSCKKDDAITDINNAARTRMSVEFDNIVGGQNLQLSTGVYTNALGQQFTINKLQYFVSNFKLKSTGGAEYVVPQDSSYFLIKEGSADEAIFQVPEGDYNSLTFTIGVDSLRSTMDVTKRTGVLDPSGGMDGMYWGWNPGYIFFRLEGTSPAAPVDATGMRSLFYHIGGYGGYNTPTINNLKTVTLDLTTGGIVKPRVGRVANVHLMADIAKVFTGTVNIDFAANPNVMFSDYSKNIAHNYAAMFRHDHTEN